MVKAHQILFLVFLLFNSSLLQAQYVAIPDANFRSFLQTSYAPCMNGGMLDTTCTNVTSAQSLYIVGINVADLSGIQYFDQLTSLNCSFNQLSTFPILPPTLTSLTCTNNLFSSLPALPASLTYIDCSTNSLTSLPTLPNNLSNLTCNFNQLTALPSLPASLKTLYCYINQLTVLPSLPLQLRYLYCNQNKLTDLPNLPSSLYALECMNNKITILPALPGSLTNLRCGMNLLTSLPDLPNSISTLDCSNNKLTNLPILPSSLFLFNCYSNQLTSIPNLPSNVYNLTCYNNRLTSLPPLPSSLKELGCGNNQLTSLPSLPASLTLLSCAYNQLKSLPNLPSTITNVYCVHNQLTFLPTLPTSLSSLYCDSNYLTNLPVLPATMNFLYCRHNQINCLPLLPNNLGILKAANNFASCLPNMPTRSGFTSDIGNTVCNSSNNNGCPVYPLIIGNVFIDDNNDGIKNPGEKNFAHAKIEIQPGNYILNTDSSGNYFTNIDLGNYTISLYNSAYPYYKITPLSNIVSFTSYGQINTTNFSLFPQSSVNDLEIILTPLAIARPGRTTSYAITYTNKGTTTLDGGIIAFTYDNVLNLQNTIPTFNSQSGNVLYWNISNLYPGQTETINVYFTLPTTILLGTLLNLQATITTSAADNHLNNNQDQLRQVVSSSFDPNYKEVNPGTDITPSQIASQDAFTYTVHFQNTGTDTAFVVTVKDTLSANFELQSIETIAASHNYYFTQSNDAGTWVFDNILLPDSTRNEPLSHGFVKYRIIPKNTLQVGDQIKNTAHIFFDYNQPISTNITLTRVSVPTSINNPLFNNIDIYPNPTRGLVTVSSAAGGNGEIYIYNTEGTLIQRIQNLNLSKSTVLNLSSQPKGMYIIQLFTDEGLITKKLIVN